MSRLRSLGRTLLALAAPLLAASPSPVNPDASPEAAALLEYLYAVSGEHTLSGQHCNPLVGSTRLASVAKHYDGIYPAVFGQDFGFSAPGTWDGINFRQNIVDEAIRRHDEGFIITLMWHAVRPIEDEPVEFRESIQGQLTDAQWRDLVTPGTHLNERWQAQVDAIAFFLRQLRDAGVPVLWRPYHEMNGGWFWWGKQPGDDGYVRLWRMLYDRLTHFHGLDNLLWVYNTNEVKPGVDPHAAYFPGHDVVDVLATDVYSGEYTTENYETLLALAEGKPIGLGEIGELPSAELLRAQPQWSWFMLWYEPAGDRETRAHRRAVYASEAVLNLHELPWATVPAKPTIHHPVLR
ncbi:MAG: glycoside hydrolase family 26 protein [Opitutales bacterium]